MVVFVVCFFCAVFGTEREEKLCVAMFMPVSPCILERSEKDVALRVVKFGLRMSLLLVRNKDLVQFAVHWTRWRDSRLAQIQLAVGIYEVTATRSSSNDIIGFSWSFCEPPFSIEEHMNPSISVCRSCILWYIVDNLLLLKPFCILLTLL